MPQFVYVPQMVIGQGLAGHQTLRFILQYKTMHSYLVTIIPRLCPFNVYVDIFLDR